VLVDDHEVVRVGLKTLLSRATQLQIVGEAASVAEAITEVTRLKPDIVLLDIRLPDGSGIDAGREILALSPDIKVLFLTSHTDDDTVLAAVMAGAHGYVLKEIDSKGLIDSIEKVVSGESILDPGIIQKVLSWMKGQAVPGNFVKRDPLSPQEERVLALVAEGKTNKEIASELDLSDKTVKNYLSNIFSKLEISRRSQAAAFFAKRSSH